MARFERARAVRCLAKTAAWKRTLQEVTHNSAQQCIILNDQHGFLFPDLGPDRH
jgi:hypothetical protein